MTAWSAAAEAQMAGSVVRPTFFLRVATPTPLRVWSGVGDYAVPADAVESAGGIYLGLGALSGLPALSGLINGVAERVEFSLSGISAEVLSMADDEGTDIRGTQVNIGLTFLGEDWQPIGAMGWLWQGTADVVTPSRSASGGQVSRRISLSVASAFTGRRRAALSYWSNNDQQRRSADDRFCERTPIYNPGVIKTWPRY